MTFEWLDYLEQFEGVDVTPVRNILETEKTLIQTVIKEAFSEHPFVSKAEAKMVLEDFEKKTVPGIPEGFVTEYKARIETAIDALNEGEIKIIINNDVHKGSMSSVSAKDMSSDLEEGKKPAGRRGRPKKVVQEEAPITEDAEEIIQGAFVKILNKWYVVDSVANDTIFVKDAAPSDDEHGEVYHKFSTEQVEEISSEAPEADDIAMNVGQDSDSEEITIPFGNTEPMAISIITPDDEESEESAEDFDDELPSDLNWDAIEQGFADELKDDEEDEILQPLEDVPELEVIEEPEDEESEEKESEEKESEEEEEEIEEKAEVEGVEDYDDTMFEPTDDTSDENGESNLFNKNNEESVKSAKIGRKFVGKKIKDGISTAELEEELNPETKEALKGISALDPRAKEFFNKLNRKTRGGEKSKIEDINAELMNATNN